MTHAPSSPRRRRRLALALLATTAIAALAGGCTQTGPFARFSSEPKLAARDAVGAIAQWSAAYATKPNDPKMALGYAGTLKAIGSRDRALEVLTAGYQANPNNGEIAAELGRLALDIGRLDIAVQPLQVAEAQGIRDWKTLSAQGTLRAKRGQHAEAQQYFLAALQQKPDSVSVINNLALSYALDGSPGKSEALLRKAVANGQEDKRVRQNLALVLGLQGKFEEARQVASVDMTETQARSSLAYLRNMVSSPKQIASAAPSSAEDDWQPFASSGSGKQKGPEAPKTHAMQEVELPAAAAKPVRTAAGPPAPVTAANVKSASPAAAPANTSGLAATKPALDPTVKQEKGTAPPVAAVKPPKTNVAAPAKATPAPLDQQESTPVGAPTPITPEKVRAPIGMTEHTKSMQPGAASAPSSSSQPKSN